MAKRGTKRTAVDWTTTPEGSAKYTAARADAQARANATGYDHGLDANNLFKSYSVYPLPGRQYRCGRELTCEVVMPEHLDRCKPGHGPR